MSRNRCDGEQEYQRLVAMIHAVSLQPVGDVKREMIQILLTELAETHLCVAHWRAIDRALERTMRAAVVIQ